MKKADRIIEDVIASVVLYRNDVEDIIDIMKTAGHIITIQHQDTVYDSLEELENDKGPKIKKMYLSCENEGKNTCEIVLALGNWYQYFRAYINPVDGASTDAARLRIKDLLVKRKRLLARLIDCKIGILLMFIAMLIVWTSILSNLNLMYTLDGWSSIIFMLGLVEAMAGLYLRIGGLSVIYLTKRHEQSTFWERNKDNIILIVFTAIISSLITLAISTTIGRFNNDKDAPTDVPVEKQVEPIERGVGEAGDDE